jgi:hypothetical protein
MQAEGEMWDALRGWLRSANADWLVDEAALGELPLDTAEEVLEDYGIAATPANLLELGRTLEAVA